MINHKVLAALEAVDVLIKEELANSAGSLASKKDSLRNARDKVQEAITHILKDA